MSWREELPSAPAGTAGAVSQQVAVSQVFLTEVPHPDEPPLLRIPLTAADLAQGSSHVVRISEGHYNPRGVTVFVPPVGYFPLLGRNFLWFGCFDFTAARQAVSGRWCRCWNLQVAGEALQVTKASRCCWSSSRCSSGSAARWASQPEVSELVILKK